MTMGCRIVWNCGFPAQGGLGSGPRGNLKDWLTWD